MGIFLPQVLSFAVVALIWAWVYNPRAGLINSFLLNIGVEDPPGWLADKDLATWAIIVAAAWRQIGYVMILYVAGLKNVDPTLLDAARLMGLMAGSDFGTLSFPCWRRLPPLSSSFPSSIPCAPLTWCRS